MFVLVLVGQLKAELGSTQDKLHALEAELRRKDSDIASLRIQVYIYQHQQPPLNERPLNTQTLRML